MVGLIDPLGAHNQAAFLDEIETILNDVQPGLSVRAVGECIGIEGTLVCTGPSGPFDKFEILAGLFPGFPFVEPVVQETGGRIPHELDRHVYPERGLCCICVWDEWIWDVKTPDFEKFLEGPLHSYFVSQSLFEITGQWPLGERRHGLDGLRDAYRRMLDLNDSADVEQCISLLRLREIKGHNICYCGSEKKVRDCHRDFLEALKRNIPEFLVNSMAEKLALYRAPISPSRLRQKVRAS